MTIPPTIILGLPLDENEPVFREPWEAQAFAIVMTLYERGLFTWAEWSDALAQEITTAQAAGDPDFGDTYYAHWLCALEKLVALKGASSINELVNYQRAWAHAAHRTPHGHPVELSIDDLRHDHRPH